MTRARVAAHRGGALLWPENSLLAFRSALAERPVSSFSSASTSASPVARRRSSSASGTLASFSFAPTRSSTGARIASEQQGGVNANHQGDPAQDTGDFGDNYVGNLRLDYVLPSLEMEMLDGSGDTPFLVPRRNQHAEQRQRRARHAARFIPTTRNWRPKMRHASGIRR